MIFKRSILISFLSIGVFGCWVVYQFACIHPSDRTLYTHLTEQTKLLHSTEALERKPSKQLRKSTRKDLWNQQRVHFQVSAEESKLTVTQKKDKIGASEELENITCLNSMGKIVAKEGEFDYPEQQLQAKQVICSHLLGKLEAQRATLQQDDEKLLLDEGVSLTSQDFTLNAGKAICEIKEKSKQIEFLQDVVIQTLFGAMAKGDLAIYRANHLTLYPKNSDTLCHLQHLNHLLSAKEMDFDFKNESIQCSYPEGFFQDALKFSAEKMMFTKEMMTLTHGVHFEQENGFTIDADSCSIALSEHTPSRIEIYQNVRFHSIRGQEIFALADAMIYFPQNQKMILTALESKRVLFWQEGVCLSAPEIHIHKQLIEGKGDVRLTLNLEEQGLIDQHISKYLYVPFIQ